MKTIIKSLCICVCMITALNGFAQGFLKASSGKIVNGNNQEVLLRGIGLGGWMLQEPYMLGLSDVAATQTQIKNKIKLLIGDANTASFYNAWLNNGVRKVDIDSLKSWGFNSIRLPLHYNLFTLPIDQEPVQGQDTWLATGFDLTDSLLSWCKADQIYLILDLHAAPGGQGHDAAISDYDNTKPSLWQNTYNQQKTVNLWKKLAERYANEQWIGGYDLLNETNWGFQNANDGNGCAETGNAPLKQLYQSITTAIRSVDQNHLLFIEGNCYANNHSGLFPLWDNNMAISFHKYWNYNNTGSIQGLLNYRTQYNVPLWMGESGENSNSWDRDAIELLEQNKIGWSWWTLKKLGLNCPFEAKTNTGFQDIINYWKGTGSQPSSAMATNSLLQLTEDIKAENCFYHKDFIDAMFRQVSSVATLPFKQRLATDIIYAADYDLGRNNFAYFDVDTADFHVSTNTYTAWNSGYKYRNDGVDIESCTDAITNGYDVGWTQDGEWLQYTAEVPQTGKYDLLVRSAGGGGQIYFTANGVYVTPFISLPVTGGYQTWATTVVPNIQLTSGTNIIKLYLQTGGSNLSNFQFVLKTSLPVLLTNFTGKNVNATNILNWTTATEQNTSYFNVQRSIDGNTFTTIGTVKTKAVNGNSSIALNYTFTDARPANSANYYRLQQVDKDGKISLSSVIKLDSQDDQLQVSVMPNPVNAVANLSVYTAVSQVAQLILYSSDGKYIWSRKAILQKGLQNIAIPMHNLQSGVYKLLINGNKQRTTVSISKE